MIGIYKFTNKINGKSYIGQSVDIYKRYHKHKTCSDNTYFHDALRRYGFDNFTFEILEECDEAELDTLEIFYIKKYKTIYPNGYNKNKGGKHAPSPIGFSDCEKIDNVIELLKTSKLTNAEIGKIFGVSDQTICDINSGRTWFNSDLNYPIRNGLLDNHERKVRRCSKCGKILGRKTKGNSCRSCMERVLSKRKPSKEELLVQLFEKNFTNVGKVYGVSATTIRRWCKYFGLSVHSRDYKQPKVEKVGQTKKKIGLIENGKLVKQFDSSYDAARYLQKEVDLRSISCMASHIKEVCNKKRKSAYGYKWTYTTDELF